MPKKNHFPITGHLQELLAPVSVYSLIREVQTAVRPSFHFLFSKLNVPTSFSLSSCTVFFSSLASTGLTPISQHHPGTGKPKAGHNSKDLKSSYLNGAFPSLISYCGIFLPCSLPLWAPLLTFKLSGKLQGHLRRRNLRYVALSCPMAGSNSCCRRAICCVWVE